jgi:hypothetical protein
MYEGTEKRLCVTNLTTPGSGSNPRRAYGTQHQHVSDLTPGSACNPTTRYASLYFMLAVDDEENELIVLEMIQHYVEILDRRGERGTGLGGLHASWGGHTRRVTSHYLTPSRRLIVVALSLVRKKHTTNRFTGGFHGCVSLENSNLSKKRCTAPVDYDSLRKVLRQRVRAGPHLQLPQGVLHPGRGAGGWRAAGKRRRHFSPRYFAIVKNTATRLTAFILLQSSKHGAVDDSRCCPCNQSSDTPRECIATLAVHVKTRYFLQSKHNTVQFMTQPVLSV